MASSRAGLSRRGLIKAGLAGGAAVALGGAIVRPVAAAPLAPTPAQSMGPFYPVSLPIDHDNDLVRVAAGADAAGEVVHILGTVRGTDGAPVAGARVEIWQCDSNGHYHRPRDRGTPDPAFQGYGTTLTDADGAYRFRTIRPVRYPGRTPHIHVMVTGQGIERLVTQLYVAGEPDNTRDGLFSRLSEAQQAQLLVELRPAPEIEAGALSGVFDIVVVRG